MLPDEGRAHPGQELDVGRCPEQAAGGAPPQDADEHVEALGDEVAAQRRADVGVTGDLELEGPHDVVLPFERRLHRAQQSEEVRPGVAGVGVLQGREATPSQGVDDHGRLGRPAPVHGGAAHAREPGDVVNGHPVVAPFHQGLEHGTGDGLIVSGTGPARLSPRRRVVCDGAAVLAERVSHGPPIRDETISYLYRSGVPCQPDPRRCSHATAHRFPSRASATSITYEPAMTPPAC